ncbi:MAG: PspC domain-containing protein [bacterium]|jgi:phage shock protein C|nr:PspC domain-containing protein [bacterium]MBK9304383.1 PspC domain-containing protein [bacterium]
MARRVLKKSADRVLVGVCGGIAEFFGWQARLVRVVFIFIAMAGGAGLAAYLILAVLMPPADSGDFRLDDYRKQ